MSGRENIYTNASIFGLTKKEIDARLDDIIAFSELEDFIDNPVRTYSSGMYMRLAFAVAINVDADILLIDEILAVGDANYQAKCFNKLREIKAEGTTIVIVSHSLGQIEQICDRSIWIKNGLIEAEGTPKDVHLKYLDYMNQERMEQAEKEQLRQAKLEREQMEKKKEETTEKQSRKANIADMVQSQVLPLADITPNKGQIPGVPKNPRLIHDDKFKLLKRSIEEDPEMLGLREILLYPYKGKNIIVGGNMRYRALKELGYTEAIVKILPQAFTAEKLRAIVIKDNSGFGEWDWDELSNVWDATDLANWGVDVPELDKVEVEEEAEEDDFNVEEHLPKKAKAKFGDIYALGKHRLICGDSTDAETVSLLVGDSKVDLLLTDPPYNVDYSSKNEALNAADKGNRIQKDIANDKMGDAQFQEFLTAAFTNANHHLKQGGAFYIWHAGTEGLNFKIAVKRVGWDLKQILIWNKNNMVLGRQDYQWKHEPCLYGWKPGAGHYFIARRDLLTVYEEKDIDIDALTKAEMKDLLKKFLQGSIPTTVIDEDKPLRSEDHPTMKPLKLMGRLIRNSTRPGEVVLDLFGGSGSTLMAAEQLGRVCYTVELDPCYIDVIIKRWEEYTGEKAKYLGNCAKEGNTEQKE